VSALGPGWVEAFGRELAAVDRSDFEERRNQKESRIPPEQREKMREGLQRYWERRRAGGDG
jgi:hypothetical protein